MWPMRPSKKSKVAVKNADTLADDQFPWSSPGDSCVPNIDSDITVEAMRWSMG